MRKKYWIGLITFSLGFITNYLSFATAQEPVRGIVRVAGDLYRFQNNFHYSVFLVTPEGIIVTDPINAGVATWLKAELKQRFNKPVKYLIYSHHHEDHISGGEVFSDTATVIAHEKAVPAMIADKVPTALPDITFSDHMIVELGGKTVELTYIGVCHSDNSIVMRFPDEKAVFAVDFVLVKSLPYKDLPVSYHYPEWLASLQKLEAMEFEILVPGHDGVGEYSDVRAFRHYLEDLESGIMKGIKAGQSVEDMKKTITLDEYKDWAYYKDWFPLNIEGMHRLLTQ